jgi:hypothetical protein
MGGDYDTDDQLIARSEQLHTQPVQARRPPPLPPPPPPPSPIKYALLVAGGMVLGRYLHRVLRR